ncbi:MAG: tyrosine-type recombinase/integrase [Anaerolineae bacterium]|nr:tyrosine-type recombinase/integrase [Anaerolineae bacterium]
MAVQKLAHGSRVEYETDVVQFLVELQGQGIAEPPKITLSHLADYLAYLEGLELAEATLRKKTIVLKTFFSWLHVRHFIAIDPAAPIIPRLSDDKKPRVLSAEECQRLVANVQSPRDAAIIQVLLHAGITLSEIRQLALSDVSDLNVFMRVTPGVFGKSHISRGATGSLHIRGKGSKERTIPLDREACEVLVAYLEKRPDSLDSTLFLSSRRKALSDRQYQYIVENYLSAVNIPNAGIHTLRHTYAVNQLKKGVSSQALKELLGLKQSRSIDPYLELVQIGVQRLPNHSFAG